MAEAPLPQGVGYAVVVGLGFAFSFFLMFMTYILRRYQQKVVSSEEFNTAGRSVGKGLIASAVVSSWTWAATLLQSTAQAYKNGVSGPFWYASGATVQVILFATIAVELKKKAPGAHTYLEVIKVRYGAIGHCVFLFFALCTNILVTSMLLTGGTAVISFLTGMHVIAATLLLPLSVAMFTFFGGIKATFLSDYIHTIMLITIILVFTFTAYCTSSLEGVGSFGAIWEKLTERGVTDPIEGNADGSYLTMRSRSGGIFFVINIIGNFGTVFLDNGYWNKAISAAPQSAYPGYLLGAAAWFVIPWLCATTMGLSALALEDTPAFPTYPNPMTPQEVSAGLVLPNAAVALLGKGGAVAALLLVFMAVISTFSAELIAASSIGTYDIYKSYINPKASGKSLVYISHGCVLAFAFGIAGFSIALYYIGISMGYLYLLMGIIISAAVIPVTLALFWKGQNFYAAVCSPVLGFISALVAWLVTAKAKFGELTVETTNADMPMLAGNVVALLSPLVFITIFTLIFKPDNFDFEELKKIRKDKEDVTLTETDPEANETVIVEEEQDNNEFEYQSPEEIAILRKYSLWARVIVVILALCLLVIWPMPMYGSGYIFSKKFFTGWVIVGIIWIFVSLFIVGFIPLWDGRQQIYFTLRGLYWDVTGQSHKLRKWQQDHKASLENQEKSVIHITGKQGENDGTETPNEITTKLSEKS